MFEERESPPYCPVCVAGVAVQRVTGAMTNTPPGRHEQHRAADAWLVPIDALRKIGGSPLKFCKHHAQRVVA